MENNETKPTAASEKGLLKRWTINRALCTGCGECVDVCPKRVLQIKNKQVIIINEGYCPQCGDCAGVCITRAITLT